MMADLSSLKLLVFFRNSSTSLVKFNQSFSELQTTCKYSFPGKFPSLPSSINFLHHLNQLIPPIQSAWQNLKLRIWTFYFFFVLPAVLLLLHMALPFLLLLFHLSACNLVTSYFSPSFHYCQYFLILPISAAKKVLAGKIRYRKSKNPSLHHPETRKTVET